jgi:hypothetical protein
MTVPEARGVAGFGLTTLAATGASAEPVLAFVAVRAGFRTVVPVAADAERDLPFASAEAAFAEAPCCGDAPCVIALDAVDLVAVEPVAAAREVARVLAGLAPAFALCGPVFGAAFAAGVFGAATFVVGVLVAAGLVAGVLGAALVAATFVAGVLVAAGLVAGVFVSADFAAVSVAAAFVGVERSAADFGAVDFGAAVRVAFVVAGAGLGSAGVAATAGDTGAARLPARVVFVAAAFAAGPALATLAGALVALVGPDVAALARGALVAGAFLAAFFATSFAATAFAVAFATPAVVPFEAATVAARGRGALFAALRTASAGSAMAFSQTYKTGARPDAAHSEDGKNTEPVVPRQTSHTRESPFVYASSTITPLVTPTGGGRITVKSPESGMDLPAGGRSADVTEPAGEAAAAADGTKPTLGEVAHVGGGDDEQVVAAAQPGSRVRDEARAVAQHEGDDRARR